MPPDRPFLWLCAGWTAVTAAPRTLLAMPLLFVLPGAASLRSRLSPESRAVAAVGLSMALAVVSGLALNALGLLAPRGWASWLACSSAWR